MNCEQMRAKLDAYIDGELSEEEARALRDHAEACEDCKNELRAAELLRDALGHMDDDLVVPLEAQAAWRRAIRAEAGRRRQRRMMRYVYAAAAALVLVVGCTAALRGSHFGNQGTVPLDSGAPVAMRADQDGGWIASDGDGDAVQVAKSVEDDYAAWKKYAVEDFDRACETLEALTEEYSGSATSDQSDGEAASGAREAMYRVELPYEYMQDFLSAASLLGTELDSEVLDRASETAIVYIQIFEQDAEK